ncbi:hypothetical protein HQ945_08370 [Phyllobacterium sp. BT25]|uniref:Head-tail adaptor protein n=1 Tax=Phyllobacterium pellucidum TaxID=2740464 RepID=A0A849VMZ7_9HYPH|nr:hypothetical protein [Phyllobacterium pellucidum]NTS31268.1 hypothetical protein [Phyllobacterium pellucidum]
MLLDVGIAIDAFAVSVTRTRKATGAYNADGVWVAGAPASIAISATIQPVSGWELKDMPEGIRTEAKYLAWSRSEILIDDVITYKGKEHRVLFVRDRDEGDFYRAALGLLK